MTVIARMILLFCGPFGTGSWLCGLVFINKDSRDRGKQTMHNAMEKLKKDKTKLMVFPEGYRNNAGNIDEFKKGAFHMAIQGQVPILPLVFSSYNSFLNEKERTFGCGRVIVQALPEIPTVGLTSKDVDRLMEQTRNIMINKFNELNQEISQKKQQ